MKGHGAYELVINPVGENEIKDLAANFTQELSDCSGTLIDSLVSASWSVEPAGLTLSREALINNNTTAVVYLSTPAPATFYRLVCFARTVSGRAYEKAFGIPGQKIDGTK